MIRAVLNSSVLVSGFLKPASLPALLLAKHYQQVFELCLSLYILDETLAALLRPKNQWRHGFPPGEVASFCKRLADTAASVATSLPVLRVVPDDPHDDPIVATAVATRADYLVTGDRRHLLPLGSYQGIRIVTPRQFLNLLSPP